MGDFTLRLFKNKKMILRFVYDARGLERENKKCADILLTWKLEQIILHDMPVLYIVTLKM